MKYQFDLLPEEYKSAPRDNIGIVIAIIVIAVTIMSISAATIKNKAAFSKIDKQISQKDSELRRIIDETSAKQPPTASINQLSNSINFINSNLDTPATDAVAFLTSLEACVPESVIIRDLNPKKLNDLSVPFVINGEASTIQDMLEFCNRLNRSGKFKAMLKSNQSGVVAERIIVNFILDFQYKPTAK